MLRGTFLHIPGIGPATEQRIWRAGCRTWEDFLTACAQGRRVPQAAAAEAQVRESVAHFQQGAWRHFDQCLPINQKWRAFGELGDRALYVDIETDGGMGPDAITVIGAYDGTQVHSFVAGRNLEQAVELLEQYPLIVTYNGQLFDMPIIRSRFRYHLFNHIHVDLRYPLRALGLRGGLKAIEKTLGIARSAATDGLDGWAAVRLWREYTWGSDQSLEVLLAYNAEDIKNLAPLMHLVYQQLSAGWRPAP